jgi:hypothetical protein
MLLTLHLSEIHLLDGVRGSKAPMRINRYFATLPSELVYHLQSFQYGAL